jgi:plastocyanin
VSPKSVIPAAAAALVVLIAGLTFAQSRASTPTTQAAAAVQGGTAKLKISSYSFSPATLTVRAGTKITVTNGDQTAHTATARSGAFDSGTVAPAQSRTFTITKPGVSAYYCQFHAFMTGTIKVVK